MRSSHAKMCHFNAEPVKFGLILTHLKLFWGQTGGGKKIFLGKMHPPKIQTCGCNCHHPLNNAGGKGMVYVFISPLEHLFNMFHISQPL